MRWVLRVKRDANAAALAHTGDRAIVEVSARDAWWGAGLETPRCSSKAPLEPGREEIGSLGETPDGEPATGPGTEPIGGHRPGAMPGSFSAEGILKEALVRLWEQARAKEVEAIGAVTIRMFEAGDGFRLLGAVGAVSGAEKLVTSTGGYETREGGSFELEFRGPVPDA